MQSLEQQLSRRLVVRLGGVSRSYTQTLYKQCFLKKEGSGCCRLVKAGDKRFSTGLSDIGGVPPVFRAKAVNLSMVLARGSTIYAIPSYSLKYGNRGNKSLPIQFLTRVFPTGGYSFRLVPYCRQIPDKYGPQRVKGLCVQDIPTLSRTGRNAPSGLHQLTCTHTTALRGFRLGARRAVMLEQHKRRATTSGGLATPPFGSLFPSPRGVGKACRWPRIACASPPAEETGKAIVWV